MVPTKPFEKNDGTPNKGAGLGLEDFYLTCAHELGHQLFLSTRIMVNGHVQATAAPNPGASGPDFTKAASSFGHDPGRFPQHDYYLDGSPVLKETLTPGKDVLDGAVMKGESNKRWLWFRHEDWLRANEQAISKQ